MVKIEIELEDPERMQRILREAENFLAEKPYVHVKWTIEGINTLRLSIKNHKTGVVKAPPEIVLTDVWRHFPGPRDRNYEMNILGHCRDADTKAPIIPVVRNGISCVDLGIIGYRENGRYHRAVVDIRDELFPELKEPSTDEALDKRIGPSVWRPFPGLHASTYEMNIFGAFRNFITKEEFAPTFVDGIAQVVVDSVTTPKTPMYRPLLDILSELFPEIDSAHER